MFKSKKYVRTITRIPDDLWNEIKNILPDEKPENHRSSNCSILKKCLMVSCVILRTGSQWKMLPIEYDSGSTYHRRFQE